MSKHTANHGEELLSGFYPTAAINTETKGILRSISTGQ